MEIATKTILLSFLLIRIIIVIHVVVILWRNIKLLRCYNVSAPWFISKIISQCPIKIAILLALLNNTF